MKYIIFCLLITVVGCSEDSTSCQLPDNAKPIHYDLDIYACDNQRGTKNDMKPYSANVSIKIQILQPTKTLTLNSKYHSINQTSLTSSDKKEYTISSQTKLTECVTLLFEELLEIGSYDLYFVIDGYELPKYANPVALYIEIFDKSKKKSIMMATNFEMTYARWLFPCWDEPSNEATFNVSITHWKDTQVVSIMPKLSSIATTTGVEKFRQRKTIFRTTPKMAIYKLYFININSEYDSERFMDLNFSLYHRDAVKNEIDYAFNVGKTAITNLRTTVSINASLPYFDVILNTGNRMFGKSTDFMGLWENETLCDEKNDVLSKKVDSALGMIRTITHEWVKHILTPATIGDFWITGGIAIYKHCSVFSQDSNYLDNLDFCLFLNYDSVINVDPKIELYYDQIETHAIPNILHLYRKAAAVMFTIKNLLLHNDFDICINQILNDFRGKTISANEFWGILQTKIQNTELRDINLKNSFEPYILQTGYPVITIDLGMLNDIMVNFTSSSSSNNSWPIPINIISTYDDEFHQQWITLNNSVIVRKIDSDYLYLFNNNSLDLFKVNYDEENWEKLIQRMNSENYQSIPPLNRAKLLQDAYFFHQNRGITNNLLLNLSDYFRREDHYIPWSVAEKILPIIYKNATASDKKIISESVAAFCEVYKSEAEGTDTLAVSVKKKIAKSFKEMI